MKPNELRVGNLFHPTMYSNGIRVPQSTIAKIITIDAFHVLWLPSDLNPAQVKWNESKYNEIEPIPLTSEWLLKFGFVDQGISWYKYIAYFPPSYKTICVTLDQSIMIREGDLMQDRSKDDLCVLYNTDVRGPIMVHTLMNIFYAVTGEELTIQE